MPRRPPTAVWILLPLLLGALYALLHPLFEADPTHSEIAPRGAVLVERFRDLATFDRDYYFPLEAGAPAPSLVLARENNIERLLGVDRDRPLYLIKMHPSAVRTNPTVAVFAVSDRQAFSDAFLDPEMLEKGRVRRAKHMVHHGTWAAIGARRAAVRDVGQGTLSARDRGEDFSIAANVPALAATAAWNPQSAPWAGVLRALGVDPLKVEWKRLEAGGLEIPVFTDAPRLARIVQGWREARLWSWRAKSRVEVELVPSTPELQAALQSVVDAKVDARIPPPPSFQTARFWLRAPHGAGRRALFTVLHALGVEVPEVWRKNPGDGGLLLLGTRSTGHPYAASFAIATPEEAALDLAAALGAVPPVGGRFPLKEGAAPLTVIDRSRDRPSPEGVVVRQRMAGLDVVGFGVSAPTAMTRMRALTQGQGAAAVRATSEDGFTLIATLGLDTIRAEKVLGSAIQPHGLLTAIAGGPVHVELRTDGTRLRLIFLGAKQDPAD